MGSRGPAPNSAAKRRRTASRRPAASPTVKPAGRPICPADLPDEAKAEWRRLVPSLHAKKLLDSIDRGLLVALCCAWAEYHDTEIDLAAKGRTQTHLVSGLESARPQVKLRNDAYARYVKLGSLFGLGAAARQRLNPPDDEPTTPADQAAAGVLDG